VARVVSAATDEPVGTAAEEAARLLESLGGWLDARTGPSVPNEARADTTTEEPRTGATTEDPLADAAGPPESAEEAERPHGPTCRACPLCRGVAYLQEAHPDVLTHLTGAAQHLVAALRSLAEPGAAAASSAADAAGSAADPNGDRPSRAVRIDVQPDAEPGTGSDTAAGQDRANSATEQEQAP
jgi:hypothetical protein